MDPEGEFFQAMVATKIALGAKMDRFPQNKVQKIWNKLIDSDEIYLGNYEGWYSIRDECFINESDIKITGLISINSTLKPSPIVQKLICERIYPE